MASVKELSRPETGEARNAHHGARASTNYLSSNIEEYNRKAYQAQRLIELYRLRPERAQLVAALIFGGRHG